MKFRAEIATVLELSVKLKDPITIEKKDSKTGLIIPKNISWKVTEKFINTNYPSWPIPSAELEESLKILKINIWNEASTFFKDNPFSLKVFRLHVQPIVYESSDAFNVQETAKIAGINMKGTSKQIEKEHELEQNYFAFKAFVIPPTYEQFEKAFKRTIDITISEMTKKGIC